MTTRRAAIKRVKEEVANAGVLPKGNQTPRNEQVPIGGKVSFSPPILMDGEKREAFPKLIQVMATQSQVVTTQAQAMMAQANQEIGTPMNKNSSTMDLHLRDFTRMNPPKFYWSKVNEDPQYVFD
ncbi:hypothetical protein EJD97_014376 [Solanum chilense]|uniref:Uncharacterized protein n=1 Tax=Solanum chilense TaxID=4083 RepID=A0A6N2CBU6_SOLCI|nr:hypothetical protein EJD97_014376 [Solanum chilense]